MWRLFDVSGGSFQQIHFKAMVPQITKLLALFFTVAFGSSMDVVRALTLSIATVWVVWKALQSTGLCRAAALRGTALCFGSEQPVSRVVPLHQSVSGSLVSLCARRQPYSRTWQARRWTTHGSWSPWVSDL